MKIKGILINSDTGKIDYAQFEHDSLEEMYKLIGCKTIEAVRSPILKGQDVIYVDEEGLLHEPSLFFKIAGFAQPIAGNGLIVGTDSQGNSVNAKTPLDIVVRSVQFMFDLMRV